MWTNKLFERMLIVSMAIQQCGTEIKEQIIYGDDFVKIGDCEFKYIETVELLNNKEGKLYYEPQSKYKNTKKLELHEFGKGEFCKFKLNNAKNISGVYAWVINNEVVYIGEAVDFKKRFNMGYGIISPRNCFEGGQKTNCKMNRVVLNEYKNGNKIDIYFFETKDYKAIEKGLLLKITTKYNVKNNKR